MKGKVDVAENVAAMGLGPATAAATSETQDYGANELARPGAPSAGEKSDRAPARPVLVRVSDVPTEEVRWLERPYLPIGKLTLLEGNPGDGKTFIAMAIAAGVTTGRSITGARRPPGTVLYASAEDGIGDTLRPRLETCGADLRRVHILAGLERTTPSGKKETGAITLADVGIIDAALAEIKPLLFCIDPLQAYLGANVDMHRANETRPLLAGLAALAEKHGCAVLCIRHLTKSASDKSIFRGLGSIDFTAAARSVLLAGKDPKDEKRRAIVHIKSSLARAGPSMGYDLDESGVFRWTGTSSLTAADLLSPEPCDSDRSALDEATEFLRDLLAIGPKRADLIPKDASKAGIKEATLRRAKTALGVKSKKIGDVWVWVLPGQDAQGDQEGAQVA